MDKENDVIQYLEAVSQLSCADMENLVDSYADGDLPDILQGKFQSHISKCVSCQELVDDVVAIVEVARTLSNRPLPEGVKERLREHLDKQVGSNFSNSRPKLYVVK